jgi:hypothetical protein
MPITSPTHTPNFRLFDDLRPNEALTPFVRGGAGRTAFRLASTQRSPIEAPQRAAETFAVTGKLVSSGNNHSVLLTGEINNNSAVCLLGNKDPNGVYKTRILANLRDGDFQKEKASDSAALPGFIEAIKSGSITEVIIANGIKRNNNSDFESVLGQKIGGEPVLQKLLDDHRVKFTALVASQLSVDPKGDWQTRGGLVKNLELIDKQEIIKNASNISQESRLI